MINYRLKPEQKKLKLLLRKQNLKFRKENLYLSFDSGWRASYDLPTNSLLEAFISLKNELVKHPDILDQWIKIGKNAFDNSES